MTVWRVAEEAPGTVVTKGAGVDNPDAMLEGLAWYFAKVASRRCAPEESQRGIGLAP